VFDVNDMFDDLPFIISQVVKEQAKMQEWKLDSIKESLKEIK
jgi:predicted transcriptional regulator